MRVHTFTVCKDDIAVENVVVVIAGMCNHGVRNEFLVVAAKVRSASRALLLVDHQRTVSERTTCAATGRQRTVSWVYMPAA